jgi:hypothetical protein
MCLTSSLTTYSHTRMNSSLLGVLFLIIMIFMFFRFIFKLILTQRPPDYLFADLIGARSVRTSNFIFPLVCPGTSVLFRGIRLWNQLPLTIKRMSVRLQFLGGLFGRTNLT